MNNDLSLSADKLLIIYFLGLEEIAPMQEIAPIAPKAFLCFSLLFCFSLPFRFMVSVSLTADFSENLWCYLW